MRIVAGNEIVAALVMAKLSIMLYALPFVFFIPINKKFCEVIKTLYKMG